MKLYIIILSCCFSFNVFAQAAPDSTNQPNFTMENIEFKSAGAILRGTIYKPKHTSAAVVIVHGSGQETRLLEMASLLANNGIAVLTYDKRGVAKSGGVYAGPEVGTNNIDPSNLNLLALDASAAINTLLAHLPISRTPIGLIGFSQAGWVIPLAAVKNSNVNFMVIFSGPLITTLEQLRFQFYTNGDRKFWETHTEADVREHIRNDPDKYKFEPTDPNVVLTKLSIRGLWIFGGRDIQVPVALSIEHLDKLKAAGKQYNYQLFPELGHNTASSKSQEPLNVAIQWIKTSGNN